MDIIRSEISGLWAPANFIDPKHEKYMFDRVTDVDVAIKHCRKTAVAVQAGGYIGYWPLRLIKTFSIVYTVEPLYENFECLEKNIEHVPGILAYNTLLSSTDGAVVDFSIRKGWGSRIGADPNGERVEKRTTTCIDALPLTCCDAIFLDIEGHEIPAIDGARETIKKFKPVITLEGWDGHVDAYKTFMDQLGYTCVQKVHMDMVFIPR